MNEQTPDQGWRELKAIIDGFVDHVLMMEKENALCGATATEAKIEHPGIRNPVRKSQKAQRIKWQMGRLPPARNSLTASLFNVATTERGKDKNACGSLCRSRKA